MNFILEGKLCFTETISTIMNFISEGKLKLSGYVLDWVVGIFEFATVKTANFSESYDTFVLTILLRTPMFSPKNGFVLFLTESSGGLKFHEKKEI